MESRFVQQCSGGHPNHRPRGSQWLTGSSPSLCTLPNGSLILGGLQGNTPYSLTLSQAGSSTALNPSSDASGLVSLSGLSSGAYSLTLTGACVAVPLLLTANVLTSVNLTASQPGFSCLVQSIQLTATAAPNTIYTFSGPAGLPGGLNQTNTANTATVDTPGTYSVTATQGSCSATATLSLTGSTGNQPDARLLGMGNLSCTTPTLTLTAVGGSTYQFSGPLGGPTGVVSQTDGRQRVIVGDYSISRTPIPTIGQAVVNKPGLYTVLVTGPDGCTATEQIQVTGEECR